MWYKFAALGFVLALVGIVSGFPGLTASGFTMLVLGLLLK